MMPEQELVALKTEHAYHERYRNIKEARMSIVSIHRRIL